MGVEVAHGGVDELRELVWEVADRLGEGAYACWIFVEKHCGRGCLYSCGEASRSRSRATRLGEMSSRRLQSLAALAEVVGFDL